MSCFQKVALLTFVLVDRCRKGFRNVSGTFAVILKSCCNTPQVFLGSRLSIKVCVGTIFEALTDNGLLVKKILLNLACGRMPILTLRSLSQSTAVASLYMNEFDLCLPFSLVVWLRACGYPTDRQQPTKTMQNTPPNIPANEQGKLMYRVSFWN